MADMCQHAIYILHYGMSTYVNVGFGGNLVSPVPLSAYLAEQPTTNLGHF